LSGSNIVGGRDTLFLKSLQSAAINTIKIIDMKNSSKFLIIFAVFVTLGIFISVQNFSLIKSTDVKSKLAFLSQAVNITSARNYYIDSINGDDTADGTSEATAWKTLARATRYEGTLDNGSTINLKRSSVWNETLKLSSWHIAPNAGENPTIAIQSYGPSNEPLPVIDGSKIIE
jgi:hypothetical protein